MPAKRIFKVDNFLALLHVSSLSTGDIARKLRCNRGTALKYLRELKAKKQVLETRVSNILNKWSLTLFGNPILIGDCAQTLKQLPDESIDLIVCDPPYGYKFMGLQWDKALPSIDSLKECLRVLKHGAFAFIMCSPRTDVMSRMSVLLQDAGFETAFSSISWVYNTGFPKSSDMSKLVDKRLGIEREVVAIDWKKPPATNCYGNYGDNYEVKRTIPATEEAKALDGSYAGNQLKPAFETILVCMKPLSAKTYLDQALANRKGVTWLDDCRIPYASDDDIPNQTVVYSENVKYHENRLGRPWSDDRVANGLPTQLYIPNKNGRFPANLLCCDDVLNYGDTGSASRYFDIDAWFKGKLPQEAQKTFPYLIVSKPHKNEKSKYAENTHPTVKPLKLMSYLITMGSREGDLVLDPFASSGTTLEAANLLKRRFIGCELDEKWKPLIEARAFRRMSLKL